jgi:hypothetical protein
MGCRILTRGAWALLALVAATLAATSASAQSGDMEPAGGQHRSPCCPPPASVCPEPAAPGMPVPGTPLTAPGVSPPAEEAAAPTLPSLASGVQGSRGVAYAPGAYIDSAIPKSMFRLRYDAGFDMNHPDRAEFFYAAWKELSFHPHGVNGNGVIFDPKARGPEQLPGRLDFQDVSTYLELAYNNRLSAFVEIPTRFVDFDNIQEDPDTERMPNGGFFPEPRAENTKPPHNNVGGLSDIQFGFKAALLADLDRYLTFQFRTYAPSGSASKGLGTAHWTVEPGVLLYKQLTDRLVLQGQFQGWIPIDGSVLAGDVLIYGVALGYDIYNCRNLRVTPVTEFVGWTVLDGFESFAGVVTATAPPGVVLPRTHGFKDASGDTIVNAKIGVRTYWGQYQDVYVGWGHSLTGDRWYRDIIRVEYRFVF